jgi:hypothetical protein
MDLVISSQNKKRLNPGRCRPTAPLIAEVLGGPSLLPRKTKLNNALMVVTDFWTTLPHFTRG